MFSLHVLYSLYTYIVSSHNLVQGSEKLDICGNIENKTMNKYWVFSVTVLLCSCVCGFMFYLCLFLIFPFVGDLESLRLAPVSSD